MSNTWYLVYPVPRKRGYWVPGEGVTGKRGYWVLGEGVTGKRGYWVPTFPVTYVTR